jgi:hypothetical protein
LEVLEALLQKLGRRSQISSATKERTSGTKQ